MVLNPDARPSQQFLAAFTFESMVRNPRSTLVAFAPSIVVAAASWAVAYALGVSVAPAIALVALITAAVVHSIHAESTASRGRPDLFASVTLLGALNHNDVETLETLWDRFEVAQQRVDELNELVSRLDPTNAAAIVGSYRRLLWEGCGPLVALADAVTDTGRLTAATRELGADAFDQAEAALDTADRLYANAVAARPAPLAAAASAALGEAARWADHIGSYASAMRDLDRL